MSAVDERVHGCVEAPSCQYSRPSASTRIRNVFDLPTSCFRSLGGRLISSAFGVRNTVVTMKKMSSRNATSTMGVMSMRTPSRRFLRETEKPFFLPPLLRLSGVSTAPMDHHRPSVGLLAGQLTSALLEVGLDIEPRRVRLLQPRDHVRDDAVVSFLVHLDDDTGRGVRSARALQRGP